MDLNHMHYTEIRRTVANLTQEIESVADERIKSIQKTLLNLLELVIADNEKLRSENKKLKDEISRLKGEQGTPSVRKQSNKDHSSEKNRKPRGQQEKKKKKSKKKKHKIKIDQVKICDIDQSQLPSDAKFKGHQPVVVQDIVIQTNNIKFKKKIYYSPSLKKTFIADLPCGYQGEFGPRLKALVLDLHQAHKMTESAIHAFLSNHEIDISQATIARMLVEHQENFHQEKAAIVNAGLASSVYQQMDDTGARVKGKNYYTHILCNAFYTAYFTRRHKDRLTVIEILAQGKMMFKFNESSYALMEQMKLPEKQLIRLKEDIQRNTMNRVEVDKFLAHFFPNPNKHTTNRRIILEASAIVAYQQSQHAVAILLADDAPQFKQITELLSLCWIHDGRHYKKLNPFIYAHINLLNEFLTRYWDYYHKLIDYTAQPTVALAQTLEEEFDVIFSTKTGYDQLDERIQKNSTQKRFATFSA
jgi:Transposase IS66 family